MSAILDPSWLAVILHCLPIPEDAPVITMFLPSRDNKFFIIAKEILKNIKYVTTILEIDQLQLIPSSFLL
jgi:hypothetical protein